MGDAVLVLNAQTLLTAMAPRRPKHDDDDFWGGSSDEEAGAAHLEREWRAREANFHSSGYREGLQEGKRETVQAGFNEGFADGAVQGFEWGAARGALSTLHALAGQLPGTSGQIDDVASHHARCTARDRPKASPSGIWACVSLHPVSAGPCTHQQPLALPNANPWLALSGERRPCWIQRGGHVVVGATPFRGRARAVFLTAKAHVART